MQETLDKCPGVCYTLLREVIELVINDLKKDFDFIVNQSVFKDRKGLYEHLGITRQGLSAIVCTLDDTHVKPSFVRLLDEMGYDIQIEYVPRKQS